MGRAFLRGFPCGAQPGTVGGTGVRNPIASPATFNAPGTSSVGDSTRYSVTVSLTPTRDVVDVWDVGLNIFGDSGGISYFYSKSYSAVNAFGGRGVLAGNAATRGDNVWTRFSYPGRDAGEIIENAAAVYPRRWGRYEGTVLPSLLLINDVSVVKLGVASVDPLPVTWAMVTVVVTRCLFPGAYNGARVGVDPTTTIV